jgi:hypothetical protein
VLAPHAAKRLVAATPDITLAELPTSCSGATGVRPGLSTIHNRLRRIGLRHKKESL